jgi:endonuclease/exonuclease/phosphatase family metal-dependent hydrolase
VKLITWNIQWALGMDGRMDPSRVIDHARSMADFDVLCLQEVSDNFPELAQNDGANQFATFAALLPDFTSVEGIALDIAGANERRKRFGNMVLSRFPIVQVLRYTLPWEADVTRNMPRLLLEAVVLSAIGPIRVMTTHLEYSSDKLRSAQVNSIREAHRTACDREALPREDGPGTYVRVPSSRSAILTGDFNMRPEDPTRLRILEDFESGVPGFVDAWSAAHPSQSHPPSFCLFDQTYGPAHCCDFIYVTSDLVPRIQAVFYDTSTQVSDHQPVLLELQD